MLSALIFDFDGLILDTEYPEFVAWQEAYAGFGLTLSMPEWASAIGCGHSTIGQTPYDAIEARLGSPIDRDAVRACRHARIAELMIGATSLPGVEQLIDDGRAAGLLIGVASSSRREWVTGHLSDLGLLDRFDLIRCADDVPLAKPAPDLYVALLDAWGLTPDQAVAFEDSANGIRAAKAARLFCVCVPNALTRHATLSHADIELDSLVDVDVARLRRLLSTYRPGT